MTDPAPGEWQRIGDTTSVLEVPGGCVMKEVKYAGGASQLGVGTTFGPMPPITVAISTCFIPYPPRWYAIEVLGHKSPEAAMERWIKQAVEAAGG